MEVFVARQPIFDKQQKVFAYELLYRVGLDNFYDNPDGDQASSEVIANSFLLIGIETMTGGKRAFINFTGNLIKQGVPAILPKELMAVEILETVMIDDELIEACRKLKDLGYMIVLDDFVFRERIKSVIPLADIIKIDFANTSEKERLNFVERLGAWNGKLLAEKVETRKEFEQALAMGYSYFQGYFFSKPVIMSGKDVKGYKVNYLQMLQAVNSPDMDFDRIEDIIRRDVTLSYKLLKYINSAAFGFRTRIESIRHALVLLGMREIRKWTSLIILRGMGTDRPDEIMTSSVIRGRFGELLAPLLGMRESSSDIFLMGIFSMIDALVDKPLNEIMLELPISEDIKVALPGWEGRYTSIYRMILAYEKGDWKEFFAWADQFKLDQKVVPKLYLESLEWANQFFYVK
jgi:c-di-GMP-related signal transduction protein